MLERSNNFAAEGGAGSFLARLAGAPISWGVSEAPGWGAKLAPERVLEELESVGLGAIELGPEGWLPADPGELHELLDRHDLQLVGSFVPLVLHDPGRASETRETARRAARLLSELGADVLVSAAVAPADRPGRAELDSAEWGHLTRMLAELDEIAAEEGLSHALHPHAGTVVETAADVERVVGASGVDWCLDTGHLALGGVDPVRMAIESSARIAHVHLKDVDLSLAEEVRTGSLSLRDATVRGLFRPLGHGDVAVGEVVAALERSNYAGWYVLEQDAVLPEAVPAGLSQPARDAKASIDYLRGLAQEAQHGGKSSPHDTDVENEEVV